MAQYFQIHPRNPQLRLVRRAVELLCEGGVIVYPSDSSYALGCRLDDKHALERIRRIRRLDDTHNLTLVCKDLAQVSSFAKISNEAYRLIRSLTPGPFTFILRATREVPRRLQHPKRKTIGIRLPENPVAKALLTEMNQPMLSSTLILPGDEEALEDPDAIRERLGKEVDLIVDTGHVPYAPTTIILMTDATPQVVRQGKGIVSALA
jgi:tRNA threonylcarbamoyl adenosine modification protein (Sua5/YciO/YrdC/YwlC family)